MRHDVAALRPAVALGVGLVFVLLLSLAPVERARAGACASFRHYTSGFAAPAGSALPANGGVLFVPTVAEGDGAGASMRGGPPLESLRRGTGVLASARVELAPGWVILQPTAPISGRITAMAGATRRAFRLTRGDAPALASARNPSVEYIPQRQQETPIGIRSAPASNTLTLGGRPPAGAYAVIVRQPAADGRAAPPSGWAMRIEDAHQVIFAFSPDAGRCQPNYPGYVLPANVDVEVFFVDIRGRLSAPVVTRVR